MNLAAMLALVTICIVTPLKADEMELLQRAVLGAEYVLIALHPINVALHYRLFSRDGRGNYTDRGKDYPYATGQEVVGVICSVAVALSAAYWLMRE